MRLLALFLACFSLTQGQCDQAWEECKAQTLPHLPQIHGWCTEEKATRMMDLIYKVHPKVCVEIGVFGGSSIFPTARALQFLGERGVVYGIDPWKNSDCLEGYEPGNANYEWWNSVDLNQIYDHFINMLKKHHLTTHCFPLRMTSAQAAIHFADESIDILHIDGNHSEASSFRDVKLYLPKVKRGGHIWFDDAGWSTTNKAIKYLFVHCDLSPVSKETDPYLLFVKR